jgi:hypothetical protein
VTPACAVRPYPHDPIGARITKDLVGADPSRSGTVGFAMAWEEEAHGRRHQHGGNDAEGEKGKEYHPCGRGPMTTAVP